ncbi:DNA-3-methyladenine glycosylase [Paenibacillus selenitireducens]|uniref:DNA-3-methyladenine glycosylase II n=1 Tax=Paenibacillus selenitireducens TaxID=1324314 RepID=A0A1T2X426_9BACL|nr:DNA-3-methyladenine glycosylase [Paenibacillus selenitireducens]OPA74565.1 DNA-3-methyladenine glycosylase [Paenibacillus selenitireducens]
MIIPVPTEFSFAENIKYLSRASNECMHQIVENTLLKLIPVESESFIVQIREGTEDHTIDVEVMHGSKEPSLDDQQAIAAYISDMFDLNRNLQPFYAMAAGDPLLKHVVTSFYGLRTIGIPDLFEALCWGIIGQQINLPFAYTLKRRLVESYGHSMNWAGHTYWQFPQAERIAALQVEDLLPLQMTTKKSEYLIGVAKLMVEGSLTKQGLLDLMDCRAAEKQLIAIRGIGPWTANYVLMRCLRYTSAFPIQDVGLHNAIQHVLGLDKKPSIEQIKEFSLSWAGWEAYATFYLWRCLY